MDETGQNVQIFEEDLFFKLRTTIQQKKKTQLIQLILCQLDVGGLRKEKCGWFMSDINRNIPATSELQTDWGGKEKEKKDQTKRRKNDEKNDSFNLTIQNNF